MQQLDVRQVALAVERLHELMVSLLVDDKYFLVCGFLPCLQIGILGGPRRLTRCWDNTGHCHRQRLAVSHQALAKCSGVVVQPIPYPIEQLIDSGVAKAVVDELGEPKLLAEGGGKCWDRLKCSSV